MLVIAGKKKNLPQRCFAGVLDYLIIFIFTIFYIYLVGDGDQFGTYRVTGIKALLIPLIWFLYFPTCEALIGQTIGKKAFNLHVVDLQGEQPSIFQSFFRRIFDIVEIAFFGMPAILTINHSKKNQRIGDMIVGTTVIRTDAICRHCDSELELSPREVIRDAFICPACKQPN